MKTTTKNTAGIKVKANVKAGGFHFNHSVAGLRIKSGLKAGATPLRPNHTAVLLVVR